MQTLVVPGGGLWGGVGYTIVSRISPLCTLMPKFLPLRKKKKFPFPLLVFYRRKLRSYLELYINCTEKCLLNKASFMSALKCKTHMTSELRSLLVL